MSLSKQPSIPKPQRIAVDISAPYPELAVERPNRQYARMIERNVASSRSEMSAIYQYLYEAWMLDAGCEELIDTCRRIAAVEMHHLNIFGELVVLLGGDPKCASMGINGFYPWNGNMLFYSKKTQAILKYNVTQEQAAADTYTSQAVQIKDAYVSAMLTRIAQAELLHRDIFESYLTRLQI